MDIQFFGKYFKYAFIALAVVESVSLAAAFLPELKTAAFFILIGITLVLSLKNIHYGIYILLAELFVGGKGHLFSTEILGFDFSLRMALFLIVFLAWLWYLRKEKPLIKLDKIFLSGYFILSVFIAIGLINGLLNNQKLNVFFDFNAWPYFALVVIFLTSIKTQETVHKIIQVLAGATTYLALKTVVSLILFAHGFATIGGIFYQWIRDTGAGEITYVSGSIFRIFMQSQLFLLIGFLIALTVLLTKKKFTSKYSLYLIGYIYLTGFAILISQSRSFWVGLAVGFIILLLLVIWQLQYRVKKTLVAVTAIILMFASQVFLLQAVTGNFGGNVVQDRFKNLQTEAAGMSRLNQLRPLSQEIIQQFIFGYGFGKTVTYQSSDPRILQDSPSGIYTTYAFEWGYLDIMLKIGVLGLLAYLYLLFQITHQGLKKITSQKVIVIGSLAGLVAILTTNIFSPYLNHPLGIGYLILISAIYNVKNK